MSTGKPVEVAGKCTSFLELTPPPIVMTLPTLAGRQVNSSASFTSKALATLRRHPGGYGRIAMGLRDFSVENAAEASDIPINICWNVGIDALQTSNHGNS